MSGGGAVAWILEWRSICLWKGCCDPPEGEKRVYGTKGLERRLMGLSLPEAETK